MAEKNKEAITEEVVVEKAAPVAKKDVVEIERKDFDALMERINKQDSDIKLLYKTADVSRLAKERMKDQENLTREVNISTWDNDKTKLVTSWKLITNRCEVIMGKWIEEQTVVVTIAGEETITVPLIEFYRKTIHKVKGEIIGESKENGVLTFKVRLENGQEMLIDSVFIN